MFEVPYYAAILLPILRNFAEHFYSRRLVMLSRFKRKVMGQGITVKRTVRHARLLSPEFEYLRYLGMLRGLRIVAMY